MARGLPCRVAAVQVTDRKPGKDGDLVDRQARKHTLLRRKHDFCARGDLRQCARKAAANRKPRARNVSLAVIRAQGQIDDCRLASGEQRGETRAIDPPFGRWLASEYRGWGPTRLITAF